MSYYQAPHTSGRPGSGVSSPPPIRDCQKVVAEGSGSSRSGWGEGTRQSLGCQCTGAAYMDRAGAEQGSGEVGAMQEGQVDCAALILLLPCPIQESCSKAGVY